MLRSLTVVGSAIVLTTAHISIMGSGGYGGPTAPLQIAVALGCWLRTQRGSLASCLRVCCDAAVWRDLRHPHFIGSYPIGT
ncbi:hypothetical protein HYPP_04448 [Hyphomicrobium sp. ghe19]|nr:hypothetical protein HYPP_04448 [Hyphomicrobium sp. ghe19]